MTVAAHKIRVYAKASSASVVSGDLVDGINDASYEEMATMLDSTDFKSASSATWKTKLKGLDDGKIDISGDFESSDAPQVLIRSSRRSGADVYITVLVDPSATSGSQGFKVPCQVENYSAKGGVDGKVEVSYSLVFNGAPTDV